MILLSASAERPGAAADDGQRNGAGVEPDGALVPQQAVLAWSRALLARRASAEASR